MFDAGQHVPIEMLFAQVLIAVLIVLTMKCSCTKQTLNGNVCKERMSMEKESGNKTKAKIQRWTDPLRGRPAIALRGASRPQRGGERLQTKARECSQGERIDRNINPDSTSAANGACSCFHPQDA